MSNSAHREGSIEYTTRSAVVKKQDNGLILSSKDLIVE